MLIGTLLHQKGPQNLNNPLAASVLTFERLSVNGFPLMLNYDLLSLEHKKKYNEKQMESQT